MHSRIKERKENFVNLGQFKKMYLLQDFLGFFNLIMQFMPLPRGGWSRENTQCIPYTFDYFSIFGGMCYLDLCYSKCGL